MRVLGQDLRFGLRSLARQPGLTLVVIVTLALGIGANASVFGLIDRCSASRPRSAATSGPRRASAGGTSA